MWFSYAIKELEEVVCVIEKKYLLCMDESDISSCLCALHDVE